MSISPFRKSTIKKIKSNLFKGGVREKEGLASLVGSSGFSKRRMEEKLKSAGYDPDKRRKIMDNALPKSDKPTESTKLKPKNPRSTINQAKDTGALQQEDSRRTNISSLGVVSNQSSGFANRPGIGQSPTDPPPKPGMPSSPLSGPANQGISNPPLNQPKPNLITKGPIGL